MGIKMLDKNCHGSLKRLCVILYISCVDKYIIAKNQKSGVKSWIERRSGAMISKMGAHDS